MGPALRRASAPYGTRGVRARLRAVGQAPRAGLVLEEVGVRHVERHSRLRPSDELALPLLPLLGFALRDSAAAPEEASARTRGGALAGGATPIRHASGSDRPRAAMSAPTSLPMEIHRSAGLGELQKVVKWLRKGGPVGAFCPSTTASGRPVTETLLHAAATNDHLAMVKELLKRGASVDQQGSLGVTALMEAAGYGRHSIVLVLLQHSANPNLQSSSGTTALMLAADRGHEACMKALLRAKANIDLQNNEGGTALMGAAQQGHEACAKALLRAKANTELLYKDGRTALQFAELEGHTVIAKLIRQHAAPPAAAAPAAPPGAGEPAVSAPASLPLEIQRSAERGELPKVVRWLRKGGSVGAICSAPARDGRISTFTLLHIAASSGQL